MYELIQVGKRTHYLNCPVRVGFIEDAGRAWLVDSGGDKDAGKKALKAAEGKGLAVAAILNTHSHADHIGGNQLIQQRTGCPAYAADVERAMTECPMLEGVSLYGGRPPAELRGKFLLAPESRSRPIEEAVLPEGVEIVPLPGHAPGMIGVKSPDDIYFLADCVTSEEVLEKYHVNYLYDVGAFLATLDRVERLAGALFIPAHAEPVEDIRPLVARNRLKVYEIIDALLEICAQPRPFEQILREVFRRYRLKMDFAQHALVGSTVRSYLSYLHDEGRLEARFEDDLLWWAAVR